MKNLLLLVFAFIGINSAINAQIHYGAGVQYNFDYEALGVQGKLFYEHDATWRGVGSFTLHLKEFYNWTIDLDAHYLLLKVSDNFNLAPFAGLNLINVSAGGNGSTEIGVNLGAFFDFNFDGKHVYAEPKLIFNDGSALAVSAGLFF